MARNAVFFFSAFLLATLIAFWPTYFTRLESIASWRVHAHGALLFAWCLLLIAQGWLIRDRRAAWHRALGKLSWLLAPLIVVSSLAVEHASLARAAGAYNEEALYFAYVIPALLALFALSWGLAMFHRRTPGLHLRYMICTPLTMIDPVFARILGVHFGIDFGPGQMITYALVDAILLWLCFIDRHTRYRVFHGMLIAFVLLQLPTFFVYKMAWWNGVATWFAGLPIP